MSDHDHPERRSDERATSTPPPTTPPPAAPPPAAPPSPAAPAAPVARSTNGGPPVRGPVATIGVLALLAVIAIIVWGGGDRGTLATGGPGSGGDRDASVVTGEGIESGQSGESGRSGPIATERPGEVTSEPTGERPTSVAEPLDPAQIAPTALSSADRVLASAGHEWLLPGRVDAVTQRFLDAFPQPGYEMNGGLGADHPSGQTTYVYNVTPTDDLSSAPVGTMYFMADPADPQGQTRVGLKIGR